MKITVRVVKVILCLGILTALIFNSKLPKRDGYEDLIDLNPEMFQSEVFTKNGKNQILYKYKSYRGVWITGSLALSASDVRLLSLHQPIQRTMGDIDQDFAQYVGFRIIVISLLWIIGLLTIVYISGTQDLLGIFLINLSI